MSKFKNGRRVFAIEQLDQRIVLSANAISNLGAEAAGEGETATVSQEGSILTVIGSDNDDAIQIELGDTVHKLTLNGELTEYDVAQVDEIIVRADGGIDTVSVLGTDQSESVEVKDGTLELKSSNHVVRVSLAEMVTAVAGEGADRAMIFDTDGDDSLELRAETASFVDKDGLEFKLDGFDRVLAFASNGGNDSVEFYDTASDDTFVGKEAFSFMVSPDYWNYARGFDQVDVFQEAGGSDQAWLFGSNEDDELTASPTEVSLTLAGGAMLSSHGVSTTQVNAGGGNDSATLNGAADVADRFTWNEESAELSSTNADSVSTTIIKGFESTKAFGGEDIDTAQLIGSDADDALIALPEVVQLTTPSATVMAHNFGVVVSRGGAGNDTAHLEDSRFNDTYLGKPNFAYLTGPGYLNLVTQFDVLDVSATNGGYDLANTHFGATIYTLIGGQASLPFTTNSDGETEQAGRFELTTVPGAGINAFTHDDLENNRVIYVHLNDDPIDLDLGFRVEDELSLETTGNLAFSVNKDGAGRQFNVTKASFTGDVANLTQPLETNYFVLDTNQQWVYGTSRNERIFGFSRARSIGPGNGNLRDENSPELYYFLSRVNQNGLITFPQVWVDEIAVRDQTPAANYDLVDGEIVKVGDATLNPTRIDF